MRAAATKTTRAWSARRTRARSPFRDRADAGRELAARLRGYAKREDCVVLALPRGGVPVAYEIARKLRLPLDVLLARKLTVPGPQEQEFGSLAAGQGAFLDYELIRAARLSHEQVSTALELARAELKARALIYRKGRSPLNVEGKTVILVDDGAGTAASLLAGVHALQRMRPAQLVVAVPVCPAVLCVLLEREADLLLALKKPTDFYAIGHLYLSFPAVSDEEVLRLLQTNERGPTKRPQTLSESEVGCAGP